MLKFIRLAFLGVVEAATGRHGRSEQICCWIVLVGFIVVLIWGYFDPDADFDGDWGRP